MVTASLTQQEKVNATIERLNRIEAAFEARKARAAETQAIFAHIEATSNNISNTHKMLDDTEKRIQNKFGVLIEGCRKMLERKGQMKALNDTKNKHLAAIQEERQ